MRRILLIVCVAFARIARAQSDPATPKPTHETVSETEARHAAERTCAAHDPGCNWVATFSKLERQSIARALEKRNLELDPEPWGKVIRRIGVVNEEVFAEKDCFWFFCPQWLNIFHITTREARVRDELTIDAGEIWDQARIEESARRLHDPIYTSVVALVPVKTGVAGTVDLLVVTRDIWSLRLNTQYTYQQSSLTGLAAALSENNFLGERDVLQAVFAMDQGAISLGPAFLDKNFLGEHLNLTFHAYEIITREVGLVFDPIAKTFSPVPGDPQGLQDGGTLHPEGSDLSISLSRPLWSLASEWGGAVGFAYKNAIARQYTGIHNDPYELYTDPNSGLPSEFRSKSWSVSASAVRQWGTDYKQQFTVGYALSKQQSFVLPSFASIDPGTLATFAADVFPRTELISAPSVAYTVFQPRYRTLRNRQTYELAEDLQDGLTAGASISQGLRLLGGDQNFTRPTVTLGWTFPWCNDGFVTPSATTSWRFQNDSSQTVLGSDGATHDWTTIDNSASVAVAAATPQLPRFRIVAHAELDTLWHNTQNSYYAIGSDSGLRGYLLNQFRSSLTRSASDRRASGQVELRTLPIPWWVFRLGAVAFYEVGGAADSLSTMKLYNDVGFGLRFLVPQTSRELFRFDLAFPLQSAPENPAFGPHFIAGFDSYF